MKDPKISDLTVSQFKRLIRETVQETVAEVIIEFNAAAEMEAQLNYEAELTEYLRHSLQGMPLDDISPNPRIDD